MSWIAIGAFALVAVAIPILMIVVSALIRPTVPELSKRKAFESGEIPTGTTRARFNIQYYMVALLFVVFDVETVLIFPIVLVYRDAVSEVGLVQALLPVLLFIGLLIAGLVWAWRNGAIQWTQSRLFERLPDDRTEYR